MPFRDPRRGLLAQFCVYVKGIENSLLIDKSRA